MKDPIDAYIWDDQYHEFDIKSDMELIFYINRSNSIEVLRQIITNRLICMMFNNFYNKYDLNSDEYINHEMNLNISLERSIEYGERHGYITL